MSYLARFFFKKASDEQLIQKAIILQKKSLDLNCSSDLHTRKSVGNLFHKTGPDTAKDRSPKVSL